MSDVTINLTPQLYEYLQKNSLREPDVLYQLRQQTQKMSMSQMQISPEQGQFMRLLVELIHAKKTLDIGTFTGYSALSTALGIAEGGKVIACDINTEWTKIAKQFWEKANVTDKIELRLAPAAETLQSLVDQGEAASFDFSFIDADKANYNVYYEYSLKLVRPGGLILIDNVLWSGEVANDENQEKNTRAIRELNSKIVKDKRVNLSMLPLGDGLTVARKI